MPLDPAQVAAIKRHLGYDLIKADRLRGDASFGVDYNLDRLDATGEAVVTTILVDLADIETRIKAAYNRAKAEQIGNLRINAHKEVRLLREELGERADELATTIGVENRKRGGGTGEIIV